MCACVCVCVCVPGYKEKCRRATGREWGQEMISFHLDSPVYFYGCEDSFTGSNATRRHLVDDLWAEQKCFSGSQVEEIVDTRRDRPRANISACRGGSLMNE